LTAANGIWGSGSFGYDALDNLRTSVVGSRSAVASIDGANRLSALTVNGAVQGYGYDANGNLTLRGSQGFAFDIGNRLTSAAGRASYAYDGHGRRTYVAYTDGSWKVQVYSQAGKLLWSQHSSQGATRHVYLGDRLVAEATSAGVSYSHTDALGSPVARTNASAQVTSRTRYEPYGATAAGTNPTGIGFTGHVNDADTGLVYMQQRYYEPVAGRFLSVDPVTTDAKDGSSFNRYVYGNNNPYKFKDPDGRIAIPAAQILIRVLQAAIAVAGAKAVQDTGKATGNQSGQNNSSGAGALAPAPSAGAAGAASPSSGPALPTGLVGTQDSLSGQQGKRHNSGPLDPSNGGTGDAASDFGKLTGGKSAPAPKGSNYPPGTQVGDNGISLRPEGKLGPRIDIPANGDKPAETLHYPKPSE
jgi:RHS repeat-associated protein